MTCELHHGDCVEVMRSMPDNSVDAIVTDPPYELGFMGKSWDNTGIAYQADLWQEVLRVLKPGGHLLSFGGTRTYHRMACAIEDAGFEIRDQIQWIYGSGFPKSLDISKAIDKMAGAERTEYYKVPIAKPDSDCWGVPNRNSKGNDIGFTTQGTGNRGDMDGHGNQIKSYPATPEAQQWQGWGTALKPANEPIVLARKPLIGTVARNVLEWGTGGLNIDGCRVGTGEKLIHGGSLVTNSGDTRTGKALGMFKAGTPNTFEQHPQGRFPANVIHDGSDEVVELFPDSVSSGGTKACKPSAIYANGKGIPPIDYFNFGDSGSAARFFYCPKASRSERNAGLEGMPEKTVGTYAQDEWSRNNMGNTPDNKRDPVANHHPTVKPIALMRYLCKLITPTGGVVLDPFMGSGTTGCAAVQEGFNFIGIEREREYYEIAEKRIDKAREQMRLPNV